MAGGFSIPFAAAYYQLYDSQTHITDVYYLMVNFRKKAGAGA